MAKEAKFSGEGPTNDIPKATIEEVIVFDHASQCANINAPFDADTATCNTYVAIIYTCQKSEVQGEDDTDCKASQPAGIKEDKEKSHVTADGQHRCTTAPAFNVTIKQVANFESSCVVGCVPGNPQVTSVDTFAQSGEITKDPYNTEPCSEQSCEATVKDFAGCASEFQAQVTSKETDSCVEETRKVECTGCEGMSFKCARYRDMKANNTTPDQQDNASRATDSDIATFNPTPLDHGDPSCMVVNAAVEDNFDTDSAKPNTETPKVPIQGHSQGVKSPSIFAEAENSFHVIVSPFHTQRACPSRDHSSGDKHRKAQHVEYNPACVNNQSYSSSSTEEYTFQTKVPTVERTGRYKFAYLCGVVAFFLIKRDN